MPYNKTLSIRVRDGVYDVPDETHDLYVGTDVLGGPQEVYFAFGEVKCTLTVTRRKETIRMDDLFL